MLSEPTDWIGGQLTSQAVPPDEHPWIETPRLHRDATARCATASARTTASTSRSPPRRAAVAELNPGACFVSRLGHEPRVALAVLEAMLPAAVDLRLEHAPVAAEVEGDRVVAVTLRGGGEDTVVVADWFLDASETGELLPLCGRRARHRLRVAGDDRRAARAGRAPAGQPAAGHASASPSTTSRARTTRSRGPPRYAEFAPRFSWVAPDPQTNRPVARRLEPNPDEDALAIGPDFSDPELDKDLWRFRRIAARGLFAPGAYRSDITLVNWPQIDYPDEVVLDGRAAGARELSLSFLHWMQTEGGFPGLRLRGDVVGDTPDGLAKHAYIREARRLRAVTTVVEQDITRRARALPRQRRHRRLPDRPPPVDRRRPLHRPRLPPVRDPARRAGPAAAREPARRGQGDRHDAHHQRRLPRCTRSSGTWARRPGTRWRTARRAARRRGRCRRGRSALQRELEAAGVELRWP